MSNAALEQLVDEVRDLPLTVSDVFAQVITECDNADASVSSLARIMAGDQALAAMVLKLAELGLLRLRAPHRVAARRRRAARLRLGQEPRHHRLDHAPAGDRPGRPHRDPLGHLRPLAVHRRLRPHPRPHQPRLRREGVRRRPAARPRPDRARLLRQGSLPPAVRRRRPSATCRSRRSSSRCSASPRQRSAPPLPPSGSSRRPSATRSRHQHDPSAAETDPLLASTVHLADWLAKRLASASSVPGCARSRTPPRRPSSRSAPPRSRASSPRRSPSSRKASRCARSAAPPSSTPAPLPYDRSPTSAADRRDTRAVHGDRAVQGPRPEADLPASARSRTRHARGPALRRQLGRARLRTLLPGDGVRRREPAAAVGADWSGSPSSRSCPS